MVVIAVSFNIIVLFLLESDLPNGFAISAPIQIIRSRWLKKKILKTKSHHLRLTFDCFAKTFFGRKWQTLTHTLLD